MASKSPLTTELALRFNQVCRMFSDDVVINDIWWATQGTVNMSMGQAWFDLISGLTTVQERVVTRALLSCTHKSSKNCWRD